MSTNPLGSVWCPILPGALPPRLHDNPPPLPPVNPPLHHPTPASCLSILPHVLVLVMHSDSPLHPFTTSLSLLLLCAFMLPSLLSLFPVTVNLRLF